MVQKRQRPFAAGHFDPGATVEFYAIKQLDHTHLTGSLGMHTAASAAIDAGDLHDPHRPGQRPFGTIGNRFQFLWVGDPETQRNILPTRLIGAQLNILQLFLS